MGWWDTGSSDLREAVAAGGGSAVGRLRGSGTGRAHEVEDVQVGADRSQRAP
ncbi:hypothetical protein GCM10028787_18420 [Brachybacterium horti]